MEILNLKPGPTLGKIMDSLYEQRINDLLYPKLNEIYATSGFSKLSSKHLNIKSRELKINPDHDQDIIQNLFNLFATSIKWTPPKLPKIIQKIDGKKSTVALKKVEKMGLQKFLKNNKVFSYAITSPQILTYTSFGYTYKSPIKI